MTAELMPDLGILFASLMAGSCLIGNLSTPLLRRLPRRRAHARETVDLGRGDRGAHQKPSLVRWPGSTAMQGRAVVPHDDVSFAPGVHVAEARCSRGVDQFSQELLRRRPLHALNSIG